MTTKAFPGARGSWAFLLIIALWVVVPGSPSAQTTPAGESPDSWQAAVRSPFQPQSQRKLSTRSGLWQVSLTGWSRCPASIVAFQCYSFRAEQLATHSVTTFLLANETVQVDAVSIAGSSRTAILGRALPNLAIITLVDLPTGKELDRVICEWPSLSPNRRFVAYLKFVPAHPGYEWSPSAEYLVYDLTAPPQDNRTLSNRARPLDPYDVGWPLYPEGAKNISGDNLFEGHDVPAHWMISPFYWFTNSEVVAFVDRWQGADSLVLADIKAGIDSPKVRLHPLNTAGVVDLPGCRDRVAPSDFEAWSRDPATLINVEEIQLSPGKPSLLRLRLTPNPCLRTDVLDSPAQ